MLRKKMLVVVVAMMAGAVAMADAPSPRTLTEDDLKGLSWRSVGPANMGGRVAAISLAPSDPKTFVIGYATGGLWKTTNNGTTFSPIFDEYETSSIGDVVIADAPADWPGWQDEDEAELDEGEETYPAERGRSKIIWVGTGEGNGRNSSSWGYGVYRSTDGGGSFDHLGLEDAHDIPNIAVHPRNPDVAYVAALGHLWGPNKTRGVYRTTDGGETWKQSLHIDEHTGACDVVLNPDDPNVVYAAMYHRRRTPWSYQSGGPEGGIYKSTNGGKNWKKLTEGLPAQTGRIGLDIHRANPKIIYAVVESDGGGLIGDAFNNRSRDGGVFRSDDAGQSWQRMTDFNPRPFYFSRIRVDPVDPDRVYLLGWTVYVSDDGGKTFRAGDGTVMHVDFHDLVIDPNDTDRLLVGNDGGFYMSHDRGKAWDFHNTMAVGQFYNVAVDNSDPYRVGGGLQDNGSWIGPSATNMHADGNFMGRAGSITNHEWQFVLGGDGFHVEFDPEDPNIVYAEWQGGQIMRIHLDTAAKYTLRPEAKEGQQRYRFNWNAPFLISPHDHTVLYHAGNHVFKFTERGEQWREISPDLSTGDVNKIRTEGSQAETHGTIVSLAESPLKQGMLWVGTDDGLMHITTDDGKTWKEITPKQNKDRFYISKIEPSAHKADRAYVAIDTHRSNVVKPMLLMTSNRGKSYTDITANIPEFHTTKVIREDPVNEDVLYVGTERGAFVSINRGESWVKLNGKSLPTVAVDDLKIQRREHDLVAGTHGRSIYILDDICPIAQLSDEVMAKPLHAFDLQPATPRYMLDYGDLWSDKLFIANNPPQGGVIHYWINEYTGDDVSITIKPKGAEHTVRKIDGTSRPGINRVLWDLQAEEKQKLENPHGLPEFVAAGEYEITIKMGDDLTAKTMMTVHPAPDQK